MHDVQIVGQTKIPYVRVVVHVVLVVVLKVKFYRELIAPDTAILPGSRRETEWIFLAEIPHARANSIYAIVGLLHLERVCPRVPILDGTT